MNFKKVTGLVVTALALNLSILAHVNAATVSVKCEATGTSRSRITVTGAGLSGSYFARVYSYSLGAWKISRMKRTNAKGVVVFSFDSEPISINAGATAIPANFNKAGKVAGTIRRAETKALIGGVGAFCTVQ
jgi:hypothetical protein